MNKLKERLWELRLEKGVSQKKLAEEIGKTNSSFSDWGNGRSKPSIDFVVKLCKFFCVSAGYIFGIEY